MFLTLEDLKLDVNEFPPHVIDRIKQIKGIIIMKMIELAKTRYADTIGNDIGYIADHMILTNDNIASIEKDEEKKFRIRVTIASYDFTVDPDLYCKLKDPLNALFSDLYYEVNAIVSKYYSGHFIVNFTDKDVKYSLLFPADISHSISEFMYKQMIAEQESELSIKESTEVSIMKENVKIKPSNILKNLCKEFYEDIKNGNVNKTKLNTISNMISKEYNVKIKVNLDNKNPGISFIIPDYTDDFIRRFMEGRESFIGFIKRNSEITVSANKDVFLNMKNENDLLAFYNEAIDYYENRINTNEDIIRRSFRKLDIFTRRMLTETKMNCFTKFMLDQLVLFDDYKIGNKIEFRKKEMDQLISRFKKIFELKDDKDRNETIEGLFNVDKEAHYRYLKDCIKQLKKYYSGEMKTEIDIMKNDVVKENCEVGNYIDYNHRMICESFGVKRLKKLPRDIITYITIECENIASSNDKMMIASYCVSKLEICEWYIALLDSDSKKFIVPHNKPYLEWMRTALLKCYKDIMEKKVVNPKTRPIIDIDYPSGYEG